MATPTPGRCTRFVIEGLGELMLAKLTFMAFVSPSLVLLLNLPMVKNMKQALILTLTLAHSSP